MFLVLRYTHFGFLIISIHAKFGKTYVVDTRYGMRPSDAPESRLAENLSVATTGLHMRTGGPDDLQSNPSDSPGFNEWGGYGR
jgi:hypothetical protein